MKNEDMNKHIIFLNQYAKEHNIIFRVSRTGITVEDIS